MSTFVWGGVRGGAPQAGIRGDQYSRKRCAAAEAASERSSAELDTDICLVMNS